MSRIIDRTLTFRELCEKYDLMELDNLRDYMDWLGTFLSNPGTHEEIFLSLYSERIKQKNFDETILSILEEE